MCTRHLSAPSRLFGAQTADGDCDWRKQLKISRPERSDLAETKKFQISFETVLFQVYLNCVDRLRCRKRPSELRRDECR